MFISACFFAKRIHKIDVNRYTLFEKENRSETIKFNSEAKKKKEHKYSIIQKLDRLCSIDRRLK